MKKYFTGILLLALLSGCINADLSHCNRKAELVIKTLDNTGADITATGESGAVMLFAFDEDGNFLERTVVSVAEVQAKKPIEVRLDNGKAKKYIAWGNLTDEKMLDFSSERKLSENKVKPLTGADGYMSLPTDIFYGRKRVAADDLKPSQVIELEIRRAVSQVHVTVVGIPPKTNPQDYTLVIANDDQAALNFENTVTRASGVKYQQPVQWLQQGKMMGTAQAFRTLPSAEGTSKTVMLYKGKDLIASVSQGIDGKPIAPKAGERVNVLIDLNKGCDCPDDSGVLEVRVVVSNWNEVVLWENW